MFLQRDASPSKGAWQVSAPLFCGGIIMKQTLRLAAITALVAQSAFAGLNDGLIAWWPFNGNANDASGNGRSATLYNTASYVNGVSGQAVYLVGRGHVGTSGDYVMLPFIGMNNYPKFTVSLWVKHDGYAGWGDHGEDYISFRKPCGNTMRIGFGGTPWQFGYGTSGSTVVVPSDGSEWGNWVLHTMVVSNGIVYAYKNGVLRGSASGAYVDAESESGLGIHWFCSGGTVSTRFIGGIDDVRIYNRALSATEVAQLFSMGKHLSHISISGPTTITEGSLNSYTCTAHFADGSTVDVSELAEWSIVGSVPKGTAFFGNSLSVQGAVTENWQGSVKATYIFGSETKSESRSITIHPRLKAFIDVLDFGFDHESNRWFVELFASGAGPAGSATSFSWDLNGDGVKGDSTAINELLTVMVGQTRLVGVEVWDSQNNAASTWLYITRGAPPVSGEEALPEPPVDLFETSFLNKTGGAFDFDISRVDNGLLILTHGRHDSAKNEWVKNMAQAIETRLSNEGRTLPNICLFDWSTMSNPDAFAGENVGLIDDLVSVRAYGIAQGQVLADWLNLNIALGKINTNAPLQIIGHSAGGHVAGSCGHLMSDKLKKIQITSALSFLNIRVLVLRIFLHDSQNMEVGMEKKYVVRLTDEERNILKTVIKKLNGSSQKVRRAQVLLAADADGSNWTDTKISEAFTCRTKTVENIRQRLVTEGFEIAMNGKKRESPPRRKRLDGEQEAKVIALRLGQPPDGFANWSLRLLAEQVVELGIVDSVSHETLRKTLKKTA